MLVMLILVIACLSVLLYMWRQAYENNIREHKVQASGQKEKVRLFFISDTHARLINEKMIASIQHKAFDAVIIGGDFVDKRTTEQTMLKNIHLLKSLGPVYFVWGNNDGEIGMQKLQQLFEQQQVRVLNNESILLPSQNNVRLSAVTYRPGEHNIKKSLQNCHEDTTIFVAHNPQLFSKVYKEFKPLLCIGGHLHGGQIRLGTWGIQPHGYFKEQKGRYELASNGYGTTLLPLRLGAKPECHIIELNFSAK